MDSPGRGDRLRVVSGVGGRCRDSGRGWCLHRLSLLLSTASIQRRRMRVGLGGAARTSNSGLCIAKQCFTADCAWGHVPHTISVCLHPLRSRMWLPFFQMARCSGGCPQDAGELQPSLPLHLSCKSLFSAFPTSCPSFKCCPACVV